MYIHIQLSETVHVHPYPVEGNCALRAVWGQLIDIKHRLYVYKIKKKTLDQNYTVMLPRQNVT